jgi:predicted kinase
MFGEAMSGDAKLDLLKGADQISDFMFGTPEERRQVYHLVDHHDLPVVKMGKKLYARKQSLLDWIEERERKVDRGG